MSIELYLAFITASALLIVAPGPNVALIVATSLSHGRRAGLVTVAGISTGVAVQMSLTVVGLAGLLALLSDWFEWLRWAGVAYLVVLGIQALRAPAGPPGAASPEARPGPSAARLFPRGFLVSITNPKTLLFYAAFLPQFIVPGPGRSSQLLLLAVTYLCVSVTLDTCWVIAASRLKGALSISGRTINRLVGGLLLTAAAGLALARRP